MAVPYVDAPPVHLQASLDVFGQRGRVRSFSIRVLGELESAGQSSGSSSTSLTMPPISPRSRACSVPSSATIEILREYSPGGRGPPSLVDETSSETGSGTVRDGGSMSEGLRVPMARDALQDKAHLRLSVCYTCIPCELMGSTAVLRGSSSDSRTIPMIPPIAVLEHPPFSSGSPGIVSPNT